MVHSKTSSAVSRRALVAFSLFLSQKFEPRFGFRLDGPLDGPLYAQHGALAVRRQGGMARAKRSPRAA
jgi:hypothetical protein